MRILPRCFLLLAFVLALPACATKAIRLADPDRNRLQTQAELKVYHYKPVTLTVMTTGARVAMMTGVMFGAIGGALGGGFAASAVQSEGQRWVAAYGLEDPVTRVKSLLVSSLANTLPSVTLRPMPAPLTDDDLTTAKSRGDEGIVLEVGTQLWSVGDFQGSMGAYRYWAQARLVDAIEAKVIWRGLCKFEDDRSEENYTQDQLKADNAAILKTKLAVAADSCADQLLQQFSSRASSEDN